jgi:hypothetical protein
LSKLAPSGVALAGGVVGLAAVAAVVGMGSTAGATGQATEAVRPSAAAPLAPLADITDVYAWMAGSNIDLVMDVSPSDDGTHTFGTGVLYAFHLTSKTGLGLTDPNGTETRVILSFASNTSVQAWVTDAAGTTIKDYVTGDPSNAAGITSIHGKIRVFAGRRSDPRFFDQSGLATALSTLSSSISTRDNAGCPLLTSGQALTVRNQFKAGPDAYAGKNVMAIVVQVDKSLVNVGTNTAVSVWGSTHAGA